jgi:hypothetical protein
LRHHSSLKTQVAQLLANLGDLSQLLNVVVLDSDRHGGPDLVDLASFLHRPFLLCHNLLPVVFPPYLPLPHLVFDYGLTSGVLVADHLPLLEDVLNSHHVPYFTVDSVFLFALELAEVAA